jgi:glycosidase
MPTKKQIQQQIDDLIDEILRLQTGTYPDRKTQGLIYSLGYLEGVLVDAIYELPIYVQREILARFEKEHLHQVITRKRRWKKAV